MKKIALTLMLAFSMCVAWGEEKLVVHEWGTFTSLQDEQGKAIGGINTDDEPVPNFVHRLASNLLLSLSEAPPHFFQGAPSCHPDVTMRLETPVIYFYPPAGWKPQPVDVHVAFRGGWLTEFFPAAEARAQGLAESKFGHIKTGASGELSWNGVKFDAAGTGPETEERVWLAPRAVNSAMVRVGEDERERFLFYRGVGNVLAPIKLVRNEKQQKLEVYRQLPLTGLADSASLSLDAAWLVEVLPCGSCAFRSLGKLGFDGRNVDAPFAAMPTSFTPEDFSSANMTRLQTETREALIAAGLFADEANALLETWKVSYFKSPGLRFFYLSPRFAIDQLLPLTISAPSDVTRVMIGRIEIVTPEQRALLKKIAAGPAPDLSGMRGVTGDSQSEFFKHPENVAHWNDVMNGKAPISLLGLQIPELYADYLKLGRFRNALILDEQKRRPTPALGEFISNNGFDAYRIE